MKTLLLLRHAKSGMKDGSMPDFERPLAERGRRDAPQVGGLLRRLELLPQVVITSAARRSRQTAEGVLAGAQLDAPLLLDETIYDGGPAEYRAAAQAVSGDPAVLLLVGHNPVMEALVQQHSGVYQPMPTAALAVLQLPIAQWSELTGATHALSCQVYRPKEAG